MRTRVGRARIRGEILRDIENGERTDYKESKPLKRRDNITVRSQAGLKGLGNGTRGTSYRELARLEELVHDPGIGIRLAGLLQDTKLAGVLTENSRDLVLALSIPEESKI